MHRHDFPNRCFPFDQHQSIDFWGIAVGASQGYTCYFSCCPNFVLDIAWQPHPWLLLLPLAGGLLVSIAGSLGTRRVIHASPLSVLRES